MVKVNTSFLFVAYSLPKVNVKGYIIKVLGAPLYQFIRLIHKLRLG
jgi:hypothetical protein